MSDTRSREYTEYLANFRQGVRRYVDVQFLNRIHLRRLRLGYVLDVGCGVGRNLVNLGGKGAGIGVDHNVHSLKIAQERGLDVYLPEDFRCRFSPDAPDFDTLLLSHVLEHMAFADAVSLVAEYLPYVRPGGKIVIMTPQEKGFASDASHVEFCDFASHRNLAMATGFAVTSQYSFPFFRFLGTLFKYNEFVTLGRIRHVHRAK